MEVNSKLLDKKSNREESVPIRFVFYVIGNPMKLFSYATQSENKLLNISKACIIEISSIK